MLLEGLTAVDTTLHAEGGVLWLFANVIEGPAHPGELCLYWSTSLEGPWHAHPANPVVSDMGTARPAGALFRCGDELIRPGQDCSRRYGEAVVLNRVDVLSTDEYRETPVGRIAPDWLPGLVGTHTYTFDSRYEFSTESGRSGECAAWHFAARGMLFAGRNGPYRRTFRSARNAAALAVSMRSDSPSGRGERCSLRSRRLIRDTPSARSV